MLSVFINRFHGWEDDFCVEHAEVLEDAPRLLFNLLLLSWLLFFISDVSLHNAFVITLILSLFAICWLNQDFAKLLLLFKRHVASLRWIGVEEFVCCQQLLSTLLFDPWETCNIWDGIFDLLSGPWVLLQHLLLFQLNTVDIIVKDCAFWLLLIFIFIFAIVSETLLHTLALFHRFNLVLVFQDELDFLALWQIFCRLRGRFLRLSCHRFCLFLLCLSVFRHFAGASLSLLLC